MNTKLDLTLPHYYEVEELQEFPSAPSQERRIYYPGASQEGGHDGLLVMVSPYVGQPWLGVFAFGYDSPKALSGIYSCPQGESLCVVSAGQGHIVRADDPYTCEEVEAYPVQEVRPLPTNRLLVFADFTQLVAYGPEGIAWTTSRLSSDGLSITEVTPRYIKGLAWDAARQREVEFFVDLESGHHEGGLS